MGQAQLRPLASLAATLATGHVRRSPGLIDEDKKLRIEIELAVKPALALPQEVGSVLLDRVRGLILRVISLRARKRCMVPMPPGTPLGQSPLDLGQGDISLLGEQRLDEVPVRLNPELGRSPPRSLHLSCLKRNAPPANSARDADTKMGCRPSAAHDAIKCRNDRIAKFLRKRPYHSCWPPSSNKKDESEPRPQGNRHQVGTSRKRPFAICRPRALGKSLKTPHDDYLVTQL